MQSLKPGQVLTTREVDTLIANYRAGGKQAAEDYRLLLDGKVCLAPDAAYRRVALLQMLRVVADEHLPPGAAPTKLYDRCPDCGSVIFDVIPVAVGEVRRCAVRACGTEWRIQPKHREAAVYTKRR